MIDIEGEHRHQRVSRMLANAEKQLRYRRPLAA